MISVLLLVIKQMLCSLIDLFFYIVLVFKPAIVHEDFRFNLLKPTPQEVIDDDFVVPLDSVDETHDALSPSQFTDPLGREISSLTI